MDALHTSSHRSKASIAPIAASSWISFTSKLIISISPMYAPNHFDMHKFNPAVTTLVCFCKPKKQRKEMKRKTCKQPFYQIHGFCILAHGPKEIYINWTSETYVRWLKDHLIGASEKPLPFFMEKRLAYTEYSNTQAFSKVSLYLHKKANLMYLIS